jgi:Ras family
MVLAVYSLYFYSGFAEERLMVGKTSLLNVFTRGFFPEAYEPTVFENCKYPPTFFLDHLLL